MIAILAVALAVVASSAQDCQVGTRVTLRSSANDPRVFVWDASERLTVWEEGRWRASDVLAHSVYARVGTRAIIVRPNRSAASGCVDNGAVAVRLLDPQYRNNPRYRYGYGYVSPADLDFEGG